MKLPCRAARQDEEEAAELVDRRTAGQMGRTMDTTGIKDLLYRNYEHPRWDDVAAALPGLRQLHDGLPDLLLHHRRRHRPTSPATTPSAGGKWDSCFTMDFSYIHGGSVRSSTKARYRQWMTHKLATWIDQFGTSGCVGCGRCITWCPVAIDITEEVRAIRERSDRPAAAARRRTGMETS